MSGAEANSGGVRSGRHAGATRVGGLLRRRPILGTREPISHLPRTDTELAEILFLDAVPR